MNHPTNTITALQIAAALGLSALVGIASYGLAAGEFLDARSVQLAWAGVIGGCLMIATLVGGILRTLRRTNTSPLSKMSYGSQLQGASIQNRVDYNKRRGLPKTDLKNRQY